MKLFELDAPKSKRVASVMSSHFGKTVDFDNVTVQEARTMLPRINKLITEHRKTPKFHSSEKNPAYLELVMLEQALRDKVNEEDLEEIAPLAGVAARAAGAAVGSAAVNKLTSSKHRKKQHKEIEEQDTIPIDLAAPETQSVLDKLERGQTLNTDEQKIANAVAAKSADSQIGESVERLNESDIEQAQVVLAAKDLVDRVQKMIEDVSEVQYKELPALVDQTRTDLGTSEAEALQKNIGPALDTIMQALQSSKEEMNTGLSALTGEDVMSVPGDDEADIDVEPSLDSDDDVNDINLDLDSSDDEDIELDDIEEPDLEPNLGRERR
jgi:urease gamma subunit